MFTFPFGPGFVSTYAGLFTVRAFLGLVEGPLVPGIILLLSSFYTRKDLAFRYVARFLFCVDCLSIDYLESHCFSRHLRCVVKCWVKSFFSLKFTQLSGTFSGLLSAAIENMNGIGGRPGWAWIFILVNFGIFFNLLQFSTTLIGRIGHDTGRPYWFLLCAIYTTRLPIFIWIPERVNLSNSYISSLHVLTLLSSGSL